MEAIYETQSDIFSAMEKLYINMKKDGEERKRSPTYIKRKTESLESYWAEYHNNHLKLAPFEDRERPYFARRDYEKTRILYQEMKQYIVQLSKSLSYDQASTSGEDKQTQERKSEREPEETTTDPGCSKRSIGSTSKLDDMLRKQSVNFKAFMRTVNGINLDLITEKWKFEDALKQINSRWSVIDQLHWEIDGFLDGEDENYENSFTRHENIFKNLNETINTKLWSVSHRDHTTPQIDIPVFTGNYHHWTSFKNLFMEAVHLNPSLSKSQKMQYLKSRVRGEAERLIHHLQISSENYCTCWEILNHRYENKKLLFSSHLNLIMNLPNMQQQSMIQIKKMHDTAKESLNAIKNLGVDIETWDPILVHILAQKLDQESYSDYVESIKHPRELPVLQELFNFLESKFTILEQSKRKQDSANPKSFYQKNNPNQSFTRKANQNATNKQSPSNNYTYPNPNASKPFMKSYHVSTSNLKCSICNQAHATHTCKFFLDMTNDTKLQAIEKFDLCKNCLYPHNCKPCFSIKRCRICANNHNTLIHDALLSKKSITTGQATPKAKSPTKQNYTNGNVSHVSQNDAGEILLATAIIKVKSIDGTYKTMRALIDQGSQISLITENGAQQLGLGRKQCRGVIFGVGENENNCKGKLEITCMSTCNDFAIQTEVLIMNQLIKNLPTITYQKPNWSYINNIQLADPEFYVSRPVDLLLGADIYSSIILEGIIRGENQRQPLAQHTQFGWLLCGNMPSFHCNVIINNMENISKFWEIEDIKEDTELSLEDQSCIEYYSSTTKRLSDGRYQVKLPLKENFDQELGSSKEMAIAQFKNLEKKFCKQPELSNQYKDFINEYLKLNHMKKSHSTIAPDYYLPHHAVIREDSTTTKLRVVFNASAKSSSGKSLNDVMCKGPNLQQDLQSLILRWRQYRYAYTADIEKMYRQILVNPIDQKYQKIVWRESPNQILQDYQLTTVTYGTKAAPFLAMMTLKQLASDESKNYPEAAQILSNSFYMDDLVHGTHSIKKGKILVKQLYQLLMSGGFILRKWNVNNLDLLEHIDISQNMKINVFEFKSENTSKTLGLRWDSTNDKLTYKCGVSSQNVPHIKMTKRKLLAEISKIFDPLGWLAPVNTSLKVLFQSVWQEELKWDDVIPRHIYNEWLKLQADIHIINQIEIPRWIGSKEDDLIEIHGFCDASTVAYAAVIYARIKKESNFSVILIAAKTKLVPHKKCQSLPRLELCGAQLLAKLMKKVTENYQGSYEIKQFGWCDSMIVLGWLQGESNRWKSFVANRVKYIKEIIPSGSWSYVNTKENPADAASRGLTAGQLRDHSLWWQGPEWLSCTYIINQKANNYTTNHEMKINLSNIVQLQENSDISIISELLQKHNSFDKITRILAWILRVLTPRNVLQARAMNEYITLHEIHTAKLRIIRYVQYSNFASDLDNLEKHKKLHSKSKLLSLQPFIDQDGILRVGGRLGNSYLPWESKHPIIIPHSHRLTYLLIDQAHHLTYHGGPKMTLSTLRSKYWIIGGITATKKQLRNCVTCRKQNPEIRYQLMADLPEARCNPAPPFYHTGVDYTGFVDIKANKGRGVKTTKGYIVIFVCMVTKAIHLELASDLSSTTFLAALKRMASRRGAPRHLYSDNGTNFVKSNRVIQEHIQEICNSEFYKELSDLNIEWHFNAPAWPTAGGLWERAVRSLKHHLKRVVGHQKLTFEEYATLLAQLEACLNTRPLCALSENIEDLEYLSPANFLTGRAGLTVIETEEDARTRWHLLTKLFDDIWKQWKIEYLSQLTARSKWLNKRKNLKIGDIVTIHDENLPAGKWSMGRVTEIHPGNDGIVRVVTLKTKTGNIQRPISKISLLPLPSENNLKKEENQEQYQSNYVNRSISKGYQFLSLAISFMLFMSVLSVSNAAYNITKLTNKTLYFDFVSDMQLIRDDWTMIAYYNMSPYWEGAEAIEKSTKYLEKICNKLENEMHCSIILYQLYHDYSELQYYNELLLNQDNLGHGRARQRRGLINGVGHIANSLFGILDESFAEQYRKDIDLIKQDNKHMAALWRNQTSVIEAEYNLLQRTEEVISRQHKTINKYMNNLEKINNGIKEQYQKLSILEDFTLSSLTTINMIANLRRIQDILLNTITDIYNGQFNLHLLTPKQLRKELDIITSQISRDLSLPFSSMSTDLRKFYKLLNIKSRITPEYCIFEIKLPLISRENFQIFKIIPIPYERNDQMWSVIPIASHVAINIKKDTYLVISSENELHNCWHYDQNYLCKLKGPVKRLKTEERFCIQRESEDCDVIKSPCKNQWFELTDPSIHLYFYCNKYLLRIICEDHISTIELEKAGLMSMSRKCIAKGTDFTFYSHQQLNNKMFINPESAFVEIPTINYLINTTLPIYQESEDFDINFNASLSEIHKKLENIKEESLNGENLSYHDIHQYTVSYLGVGAIIGVAAIWWLRRFRKVPTTRNNEEPAPDQSRRQSHDAPKSQPSIELSEFRSRIGTNDYHRDPSMVNCATSPIVAKRVSFKNDDDTHL